MKVKVLGCSGGVSSGHDSTCLILNDDVLLDAGTGARKLNSVECLNIKDIILSHSHLDHITSICFIADQDIENRKESTRVHALPETSAALRRYIVNEIVWPEIEKVIINGVQMVEFHTLRPFDTVDISGCKITPLPVTHAVPTLGFVLHGEKYDMVFNSDMITMSDECYDFINKLDNLKYFITEAAFPNRLEEIAHISKHLTPQMMQDICKKIKHDNVDFFATHIKPLYYEQVCKELGELEGDFEIKVLKDDMEFEL